MKKVVWSGAVIAAVVLLGPASAFAQQTANASIAVTANVNAKAKLTLGTAAITFADADPDVVPTFTSAPVSVDVKARTTAAGNVTLTVLASGDLTSGSDTIAVSNLTWTVTGGGFQPGTNNKTTGTREIRHPDCGSATIPFGRKTRSVSSWRWACRPIS